MEVARISNSKTFTVFLEQNLSKHGKFCEKLIHFFDKKFMQ